MAEIKYGQLSDWNDGSVSLQSDFLNLTEGNNIIKVITNPYQFVVHWIKDMSGASRKIRCAVKDCPLCKKGIKPQYRWYIGVLDRKSALPKILEISQQIYKGIKDYITSEEWGEFYQHDWGKVMAYDINVKRGPKGTNPLYTVIGSPKKKNLTDEEVALINNFFERVNIAKFTQPPTPEEVAEKMGDNVADASLSGNIGQTSFPVGKTRIVDKPVVRDEDFDFGDDA